MPWTVDRWATIDGLEQSFGDRSQAPPPAVRTLRQVHGTVVRVVDESGDGAEPGDGLATDRRGLRVGVWTADCVPVHLVAPGAGVVAAVHCGWRGSAAGILREAFERLVKRWGVRAGSVEAALGPAIGGCCYEVGEEVRAAFVDRAGAELGSVGFESRGGSLFLDLRTFLEEELRRIGVVDVARVGPCTACRADLLHSYRRRHGEAGRQLSWIGWRS
jgi:YfiH family protein